MSRTYRGEKGPGHEYWKSRLCPGGETPGRWTKRQTHRKERREGNKTAQQVPMNEDEDDSSEIENFKA